MKPMNGMKICAWKTVLTLIFSTFFLTACKQSNEASAGICNGNWAIAGGYYCDLLPIGGGQVLCIFLGQDNDRNGKFQSGTSDKCVVDSGDGAAPIDCNRMCELNNDCSRIQCPAGEKLEELNNRLSKPSIDLIKKP
ncbi:hypothetical protein [Pseudomonas sp. TMB3-21]